MSKVTSTVVLSHPDSGELTVLRPGDEVPRWAKDMVTNPAAFAEADDRDVVTRNMENIGRISAEQGITRESLDSPERTETDDDFEDVEDSYESWTVSQLKAECDARGLPVSGSKAELITRLEESDAAAG